MSRRRFFQEHWKELVATQPDRQDESSETADGDTKKKPEEETLVPGDSPWKQARAFFHRYRYISLAVSCFILAFCLIGVLCAPDHRPDRVHVSGQVLIDGEPLTSGSIVFVPALGRGSVGNLDEQGRFTLSCYDGKDGAVPGTHSLEISADVLPTETEAPWPVPSHYANYLTSGLKTEITGPTRDLTVHITTEGTGSLPKEGGGDRQDLQLRPEGDGQRAQLSP